MALYEGIALIQEKQAVVLDLGTDYTKFGFTGEAAPRCIIRSEFWSPTENRFKRVHDYKTAEELYDNLVHMLHVLYFRHVLVNPKERKVVVVESLLTTTLFRETLAQVLFIHYEVSAVVWADGGRLSALTLGAPLVLVVSIGALEAEVVAVVHGVPVLKSLQAQPLGARALDAELARRLRLDNAGDLHLSAHVLEDIRVRLCFVAGLQRAADMQAGSAPEPRAATYPLAGGAIKVSGATRWRAAEVLFARDNELASLPDIVLQSIIKCPIDTRRALAENILVTGGAAALAGLRARLAAELRALVLHAPYRDQLHVSQFGLHSAPAHDNTTAWLGGALLGAADPGTRALPRDHYTRIAPIDPEHPHTPRRLRDWASLLHTTPRDHPHWDDINVTI